jgi:hypothetical protein
MGDSERNKKIDNVSDGGTGGRHVTNVGGEGSNWCRWGRVKEMSPPSSRDNFSAAFFIQLKVKISFLENMIQ